MAEGLFNKLAPKGWRALSAGTMPATQVNPNAIKVMKEIGIDISRRKPKLLQYKMIQAADQVITMGCLVKDVCPAVFVDKVEDWNIEDPAGKPIEKFREVRDEIRKKVEELIQRIKQSDENEVKSDQC